MKEEEVSPTKTKTAKKTAPYSQLCTKVDKKQNLYFKGTKQHHKLFKNLIQLSLQLPPTFHNDKATIHWSNKNLVIRLPSIMTRIPSIGVTKI